LIAVHGPAGPCQSGQKVADRHEPARISNRIDSPRDLCCDKVRAVSARSVFAARVLALSTTFAFGCGSSGDLPEGTEGSVQRPPRVLNQASLLGYNLDFPGDWTDQPPFIDWMKNSRAPVGLCSGDDPECDQSAHLDLDANGWPRSLQYRDDPSNSYRAIEIIISSSDEGPDVGERFAVTWDGSASIQVENGGSVQREASRLSFTLQSDVTLLRLTEIEPRNYPRNIRVFRTDFEDLLQAGEVFDPETLEFLAPFRSLRFMDWMQSNAYGQCSGGSRSGEDCYAVIEDECGSGRCLMPGHWQERPLQTAPSWLASGQYLDPSRPQLGTKVGGYALETLVALANRLPADPHFNLPADYDEDYVRRFAEYVKGNLSPELVATIEYSNEVWNFQFPQAEYANQQGQALWGEEEGSAWVQYAAGRAQQACGIVKQVFRGEEERVRCVISPQTNWRDLAEEVLDCPDWAADHGGRPCSEGIDAVSITGYFAGCMQDNPAVISEWLEDGQDEALDRAFEQLEHGGLIDECEGEDEDNLDYTIDGYNYFSRLARERGLGLYVYESGTHFSYEGDDDEVQEFFVEMTRDSRMRAAYLRNFQGFERAGGQIMNVWGWIAPDSPWANADSIRDRQHPKYRAIADFVDDHR
jgi:hypothetical protein